MPNKGLLTFVDDILGYLEPLGGPCSEITVFELRLVYWVFVIEIL